MQEHRCHRPTGSCTFESRYSRDSKGVVPGTKLKWPYTSLEESKENFKEWWTLNSVVLNELDPSASICTCERMPYHSSSKLWLTYSCDHLVNGGHGCRKGFEVCRRAQSVPIPRKSKFLRARATKISRGASQKPHSTAAWFLRFEQMLKLFLQSSIARAIMAVLR